jgi:hypothetical protein
MRQALRWHRRAAVTDRRCAAPTTFLGLPRSPPRSRDSRKLSAPLSLPQQEEDSCQITREDNFLSRFFSYFPLFFLFLAKKVPLFTATLEFPLTTPIHWRTYRLPPALPATTSPAHLRPPPARHQQRSLRFPSTSWCVLFQTTPHALVALDPLRNSATALIWAYRLLYKKP